MTGPKEKSLLQLQKRQTHNFKTHGMANSQQRRRT